MENTRSYHKFDNPDYTYAGAIKIHGYNYHIEQSMYGIYDKNQDKLLILSNEYNNLISVFTFEKVNGKVVHTIYNKVDLVVSIDEKDVYCFRIPYNLVD